MKKFKRLLISLLAVALIISAGGVAAFAAEDGSAITDGDINKLAELYENGVYYAEDFEAATSIRSDSVIVDESGVIADSDSMLKLVGAASDNKDVYITARPDGNIAGFVLQVDIAANGGVFNIYASGESATGEKFANVLIMSLDFSAEEDGVLVQKFGLYEMPVSEALDGVSLVKDAWYSLCFIYDAAAAKYSFELTQTTDADGAPLSEAVTYTAELPGLLAKVNGAKLAISGTTIADKTMYLDDLYFYEGKEIVDYAASEAKLGAAVVKLVEKLSAATASKKADIVKKLQLFVDTREFNSAEYEADIKFAKLKLAEYFTASYVSIVNSYNKGDIYTERAARVDEMKAAFDAIPEIPVYTEDENADAYALMVSINDDIAYATTVYNSVVIELNNSAEQSMAFMSFMSGIQVSSNRYEELKSWVEVANTFDYDPTFYAVVNKDGVKTVYDIANTYQNYIRLVYKYETLAADCEKFIGAVNVMKNDRADFADRYYAYLDAVSVRFLDIEYTYYTYRNIAYTLTKLDSNGAELGGEYLATNSFGYEFTVTVTDTADAKTVIFTAPGGNETVWTFTVTDEEGLKVYADGEEIADAMILSDDGALIGLNCDTKVYPLRDVVSEDGDVLYKGSITLFNELKVDIDSVERICVNFIACVSDAKACTNISSLNLCLAKAERYDITGIDSTKIALELSYPGVVEAIADYDALYDKRLNDEIKANRFVEEVEAIKSIKDRDALKAAMAKISKPKNILDGFAGYSEAMSYYSDLEATILYNETNAKTFIALVNSIAGTASYKEKYEIINAALTYVPELDMTIEGVSMANAVLSASIRAYDAEVQKTNDASDVAVGEAAKIASAVAPTDAYLRVVAIIKKIFD